MKTALFTVVYPNALPYFNEFLNSLGNQTDKDFTVFLANDGVSKIEKMIEGFDFNIVLKNIAGTPSSIRKAGLEWILLQGAETIVFADCDDLFKDNRIEVSKRMLCEYDMVFNELKIFGSSIQERIPMLGPRFKDGEYLSEKRLRCFNCLGLSNTAINVRCISKDLSQIPDEIIAFDWAFFWLCLNDGTKAVFTAETETYYRQHESNMAWPQSLNEDQVMRGVQVKRDHYRFISRFLKEYETVSNDFDRLYGELTADSRLRDRYCHEIIRRGLPFPLWWEQIKLPEELE